MKKILIFTSSRSDYGLLKNIIFEIKKFSKVLICCGPQHFDKKLGNTYNEILRDNLFINFRINFNYKKTDVSEIIEAMSLVSKQINQIIKKNHPDLLIVLGDRYETFAATYSAYCSNLPIAHIHGGEITQGAFDEGFRHSISKMSDIHFVSHDKHKKILKQLGENKNYIFNFGAPGAENAIDYLKGKSANLNQKKPYIMVTYHPETKNIKEDKKVLINLFRLIKKYNSYDFYFTSTNSDTNGAQINAEINRFCDKNKNSENLYSLGHKNFIKMMSGAKILIGNSSSSIVEGSTLQIPAVNIGNRQGGRTISNNIVNSKKNFTSIEKAFLKAEALNKKDIKRIFFKKNTSLLISNQIKKYLNKKREVKKFYVHK